jgi:hypothetical protein
MKRSKLPPDLQRSPVWRVKAGDKTFKVRDAPFGRAFRSQLEAARKLKPDDPKRTAWAVLERLSLRDVPALLEYVPKAPGRPRGSKLDQDLLFKLRAADRAGRPPLRTVARRHFERQGRDKAQLKNLADAAVTAYRKERF